MIDCSVQVQLGVEIVNDSTVDFKMGVSKREIANDKRCDVTANGM